MSAEPWHLSTPVWQRYAAGELDAVAEASVETHLTSCAVCQSSASEAIPSVEVAALWEGVATAIAQPRSTRLGRLSTRLGLPEEDAVVVRASTALHVPWVISVSAALLCAALAAVLPEPHGTNSFVVIAPLIPVLAIAAAYDATDPLRELVGPTPLSKLRIALLRACVALAAAVPVTLAVGILLPGLGGLAFAWLLPSLALTLVALLLLTWLTAPIATATVAGGWVAGVLAIAGDQAPLAIGSTATQSTFLGLAVVLSLLLWLRTSSTRLRGGYS
jgi:hypothetical protein